MPFGNFLLFFGTASAFCALEDAADIGGAAANTNDTGAFVGASTAGSTTGAPGLHSVVALQLSLVGADFPALRSRTSQRTSSCSK